MNRWTFRFRADAPVLDQRHAEDRIEGLLQIAYRCSNPAASECRCNAGLNALVLVSRCGWTPTTKRASASDSETASARASSVRCRLLSPRTPSFCSCTPRRLCDHLHREWWQRQRHSADKSCVTDELFARSGLNKTLDQPITRHAKRRLNSSRLKASHRTISRTSSCCVLIASARNAQPPPCRRKPLPCNSLITER